MNAESAVNDKQNKKRKPAEKIVNIIAIVFAALILIIGIFTIASIGKGYTSFFGTAFIGVETDSMAGDKEDSFKRGDLLFVKILDDDGKQQLEVGDIVTFYDLIEGVRKLNTHRIIEAWDGTTGRYYKTQGDANTTPDAPIRFDEIVGVCTGKIGGLGHVSVYLASPSGFFVVAVVPSILLVIYCIFRVIMNALELKNEKAGEMKELLREQLKAELLAQQSGKSQDGADSSNSGDRKQE